MLKHPATFSPLIIEAIATELREQWELVRKAWSHDRALLWVLDPFAGIGKIHQIDPTRQWAMTYGVELEPEWADQHPHTACGDSTKLAELGFGGYSFDTIATSVAYGNRMADQYLPPESDTSKRFTYAVALGRKCSDNSSAAMQWHDGFRGDPYRQLHADVWDECDKVLRPGGRVVLNCKNHIRKGAEQHVTEWHIKYLMDKGYELLRDYTLETDGIKFSPYRARFKERMVVLVKPSDDQLMFPSFAEHKVPSGASLDERFNAFHDANPWVMNHIVAMADDLVLNSGVNKFGVKLIVERMRWDWTVRTGSEGGFRLNNSFTSRYARMLLLRRPQYESMINTRSLKT
jgi:hypothetical protein